MVRSKNVMYFVYTNKIHEIYYVHHFVFVDIAAMNQGSSDIVASVPPSVTALALVGTVVAVIFLAKRLLPDAYRWDTVFRDLLVDNLGDRK